MFTGDQIKCWEVVCTESCGGVSHSRSLFSPACHFTDG